MAELTNTALQTVLTGQNVVFTETPIRGNNYNVVHREGAGVVTLKGNTKNCFALYKVTFGGNIAVPTGGTVGAISLAIAINGEALQSAIMTETPSAVAEFSNVFSAVLVKVPCGCCVNIAIENISTQAIAVDNANLIIERVA